MNAQKHIFAQVAGGGGLQSASSFRAWDCQPPADYACMCADRQQWVYVVVCRSFDGRRRSRVVVVWLDQATQQFTASSFLLLLLKPQIPLYYPCSHIWLKINEHIKCMLMSCIRSSYCMSTSCSVSDLAVLVLVSVTEPHSRLSRQITNCYVSSCLRNQHPDSCRQPHSSHSSSVT